MQLPFGEWLPDQPEYLNPGATTANNVYYAQNSYKRFPSLVNYSTNNIGADSRGAGSFRDNSGNVFNFVAKNTDIYQLDGGSFTSRKGSLTGGNTDYFTFTQFGNYIIASNGVDAPQYYLMGTSTNFAPLSGIATSGTVPTFRVSGVVRDFLITGNQPSNQNRIQWSGINDIATWQSGTKQADQQDLPGSGGEIVHITSGEIGYVFRQNQIVRMDYVGGATIFRLSVISPNRGAVYGRTVCQDNRRVFFYADDGFFEIQGDNVVAIGAEKINRFFDVDLNKAFADRICAAVDPFNQLALWLYPSASNTANTTGICDKILIYNYATQKWSTADANASTIFSQFVGAYTVELMDIISENLDQINIALDTDFWSGGQLLLGAIDSNFKASIFSGTENQGTIETRELELFPGHRSSITNVRPIIDATATVTIKSKERLSDDATVSTSSSMVASGDNPVRQSGRYFRIQVITPSGTPWTHAQGVDLKASRIGLR
ncbi:Phage stabilisation protein [uncultured Mediterranean phage uvMED]|nr:Phage stabilisation protein [uncultured Mediterranean phage uvMED]BAR18574.1 Phage stabilisation protein [uncultured Mediterranean phage uvMED]BAR18599.1 Phage stabilisation protein [uncultured Mediterranean phage uvMED]BAR18708.1 Phage stabilisation protein [uncultured Mediterranean phage uvMED]BAR18838.1 Phage stabilisation protein [uncultured Mediterranean phage uvMED]